MSPPPEEKAWSSFPAASTALVFFSWHKQSLSPSIHSQFLPGLKLLQIFGSWKRRTCNPQHKSAHSGPAQPEHPLCSGLQDTSLALAWEGGSDTCGGSCGRQSQNWCAHFLLQTQNWRNTQLGQNKYVWHLSCFCTAMGWNWKQFLSLIYTKVSFHHFGSRKGLTGGTCYIFFLVCVNEDQAFTWLKIDGNDPFCCQNNAERPFCN